MIKTPNVETERRLSAWLDCLTSRRAQRIELGLHRVREVAHRLKLLDKPLAKQVIMVAGTNGKGSSVALLESMLQAAHYRTAAYTSPHLVRYNERLRINQESIDDDALVTALDEVEKARCVSPAIDLTFFEVTTLACALITQMQAVDVAILEIGLGGRLDAVNIFDADIALITTISKDHTDFLGSDLEQIGREKAGIMRPQQFVVLGDKTMPASVLSVAKQLVVQGPYQLGQQFSYVAKNSDQWSWQGETRENTLLQIDNLPNPQLPLDNAASAIQVLQLLAIQCDCQQIKEGLSKVSLSGRLERNGRYWLDVAHNPQAAQYLAKHWPLRLDEPSFKQPRIVLLGMLADKDAQGFVEALDDEVDGWIFVGLNEFRGQSGEKLAKIAQKANVRTLAIHTDVNAALDWLVLQEKWIHANILICGSFYTVAQAQKWLLNLQ